MKFQHNDGGRSEAGYKGDAGDCVVRAISIATKRPYQVIYDELKILNEDYAVSRRNKIAKALQKRGSSPRNGNFRWVYHDYIQKQGFEWIPTMQIGSGCTVHLNDKELPLGILIVRVSRHLATVIDGVLNDTHDCSRFGQRCVYGYYRKII